MMVGTMATAMEGVTATQLQRNGDNANNNGVCTGRCNGDSANDGGDGRRKSNTMAKTVMAMEGVTVT